MALVTQWLRAGIEHPDGRTTAFRYAAGISLVQVGWLLRLVLAEAGGGGLARRRHGAFLWGYGHVGVFAALAAVGAGLEVAVEGTAHDLDVSAGSVAFAVCLPVACSHVLLWAVHGPLLSERSATRD